jgi:hypothetical protein
MNLFSLAIRNHSERKTSLTLRPVIVRAADHHALLR